MSRSFATTLFSVLWFACCMLAVFCIWIGTAIARASLTAGDWVMRLFISEEELP